MKVTTLNMCKASQYLVTHSHTQIIMAYGHDCYGAQYYKNHLICISSLIF